MFVVSHRHSVGLGRIEPPIEADAPENLVLRANHLAIASASEKCRMECFVHSRPALTDIQQRNFRPFVACEPMSANPPHHFRFLLYKDT